MAERSDLFTAFQKNLDHPRIERVIGRCIASTDKTSCRSREIVSETRELLAKVERQFGLR